MTLSLTNQNTPPVTVSHNPDGGATMWTGGSVVVLNKDDAAKLGRYLLFQDDSDPSTPYPEVTEPIAEEDLPE